MKAKYKLVDIFESRDTIGYANSKKEVNRLIKQRIEETESECLIELRVLNNETQKYKFKKVLLTYATAEDLK